MKIITLILVLGLVGCSNCLGGFSAYCEDTSYSEVGKKYKTDYEEKLAKKEAAQKAAKEKLNNK